ncbi:MAG: 50S ribosomal protein L24 [Patescibacteria group bacterium]
MKLKRGDTVKIISGKDRGKTGKIIRVLPPKNKIIVEGVNVRKKHSKPKRQGQKGQIIQMAMPIDVSNAILICPSCSKQTRIGKKTIGGVKKIRFCKKCKAELA